jgi:ribosomal-protein-alanine N-acetyltransferase
MFIIRNFKPEDLDQVLQITFESFPERYNPNVFINIYQAFPEGFLVAEKIPNAIVGFLLGVKTSWGAAKILLIAVKSEYRRKGIGSKLLRRFLREMVFNNIKKIELEVRVDNKIAVNFYRKHGFEIIDVIPNFYRDKKDAYVLRRII